NPFTRNVTGMSDAIDSGPIEEVQHRFRKRSRAGWGDMGIGNQGQATAGRQDDLDRPDLNEHDRFRTWDRTSRLIDYGIEHTIDDGNEHSADERSQRRYLDIQSQPGRGAEQRGIQHQRK